MTVLIRDPTFNGQDVSSEGSPQRVEANVAIQFVASLNWVKHSQALLDLDDLLVRDRNIRVREEAI